MQIQPAYIGRMMFLKPVKCYAHRCEEQDTDLMAGAFCSRHWKVIPFRLQTALKRSHQPTLPGVEAPADFVAAVQKAVAEIAHRERIIHKGQQTLF